MLAGGDEFFKLEAKEWSIGGFLSRHRAVKECYAVMA